MRLVRFWGWSELELFEIYKVINSTKLNVSLVVFYYSLKVLMKVGLGKVHVLDNP